MRVFIASGIFHPDSGGPATYLYRLLPELQRRGHDVRALAYGNASTSGYPYPLTRIPFQALPLRMGRYALAYWRHTAWADLIYINNLGLPRSMDGGKPRVLKVVGDYAWERSVNRGLVPPDEDIDAFQTKRYSRQVEYFKASRAREVQQVDLVIVPSNYLREMVIGWGASPSRVKVIYNALDSHTYHANLSRQDARQQLGWQVSGQYLLTAARLTAWKGVDMLVDAVAQLHTELPALRLVVAGDGPELPALKARAEHYQAPVTFLGKVPHEQMGLLMRATDYFILYSGYEGLSHVLLESLYAGTPVIASRRGGNPEVVADGVNGLLVDHPNPAALVQAIHRAFEPNQQSQFAAHTAQGLDRFDWPHLVDDTLATLTQVHAAYQGKRL